MICTNPFANYGTIVKGSRFIGRRENMSIIENRVINPPEPGNIAIVGEPRIGKSSLVYKAIMERKDELHRKHILPCWFNLGTLAHAQEFFHLLVAKVYDEVIDLEWNCSPVERAATHALAKDLQWSESLSRVMRFFEKINQAGIRVIAIIDEFDHARHLFKDDIKAFQGLRELSYQPSCRITYITTSRRPLIDIEHYTGSISNLNGIFYHHVISNFDRDEQGEFLQKLSALGIQLDSAQKEHFDYYCGGHPFLMDMLGFQVFEDWCTIAAIDIDGSAHKVEHSFIDHYDRMIELRQEDGNLHKLLQVLFGPVVDVKKTDVDFFLRHGLIVSTPAGVYHAFSRHFHQYLQLIERQVDLWPLWRETERTLRSLISSRLIEIYGELWPEKIEKARAKLKSILDACRESQRRELNSFGNRASANLLDFTYPVDLFAFVFAEWDTFKSIFGRDKAYWEQRAQLLSKMRNPLAHNRDDSLYDYEKELAEGYCKEILSVISRNARAGQVP
jgi:hypothetical protein